MSNRRRSPLIESLESRRLLSYTLLQSPAPEVSEHFGETMASDGSRVLIGAPDHNGGVGQVHLRDSSGAMLTIDNPLPASADSFGSSVAFVGTDILVGASNYNGGSGRAYLFNSDGVWIETFENPYGAGDFFGGSVAASGDNVLIQTVRPNEEGGAFVTAFTVDRNLSTAPEAGTVFSNPSGQPDSNFGSAMAVSGGNVLIGASGIERAFLFNANNGDHLNTFELESPSGGFGSAVAFAGGDVLVGDPFGGSGLSGAVYRFEIGGTSPADTYEKPSPDTLYGSERFGIALAVVGDNVVIGAPRDVGIVNNDGEDIPMPVGAAYVIDLATGSLEEKIDNPTIDNWYQEQGDAPADEFGHAIVVADGKLFISDPSDNAQADDAGAVFVLDAAEPPPASPVVLSQGILTISGAAGDDDIQVNTTGGGVSVSINGLSYGAFAPTVKIVINGSAGNDVLQVSQSVTLPAEIYGGAGDDFIRGGGGNDLLFGGDDSDTVIARGGADVAVGGAVADLIGGGTGRDVLIGGTGADDISGNQAEDILIAGFTTHDNNIPALIAIRNEWSSANSFTTRVNNIRDGDGLNGTYTFTPGTTVSDDAVADVLFGGQGSDWLLFNADGSDQDIVRASSGDVYTDLEIA